MRTTNIKKLKNDLNELEKKMKVANDEMEKSKEKYLKAADLHELSEKKLKNAKLQMEDDTNLEFGKERYNEMETAYKNDEKDSKELENQYKEKIKQANEIKKVYVPEKKRILNAFQDLEEKRIVFHENICGVYGKVTGIGGNHQSNGKAELQKWIQQNKSKEKPNLDLFEFVAYKPHYPDIPYEKKGLPDVDLTTTLISMSEFMDNIIAGNKQGFREFDSKTKAFSKSYSKKHPHNIYFFDLYIDTPKGLIVSSLPPCAVFDPKAKLGKILEFPHLPVVDKAFLKIFTNSDNLLKFSKGQEVNDPKFKKPNKKKPEPPNEMKLLFHTTALVEINEQTKKFLEAENPSWDNIKSWSNCNDKKVPALKFMQHKSKKNFLEGGLKFSVWRTCWATVDKQKKEFYAIEYTCSPQESGNDPQEEWIKRCTFMQKLF
eukprot:TRINITY_DN2683_c0_g1_i2.p1 TRINITY_DN2683_c0_g1~~TRINITY_DN2683_c0_g1_i2.p1  ORF type:complete len:431 (+),score=159.41 TRINITY_DN2683_c0_g1_i2:419-1711(+)